MSDDHHDTSPSDEAKRKFREALDKKNNRAKAQAEEGEAHLAANGPVTHAAGKADNQKEFRRKSV